MTPLRIQTRYRRPISSGICRVTRQEKSRIVSERVAARIREVAPAGLGHWDLVAQPSDVFVDALADWRAEDSFTTRMKLEAATTVLVEAWAEAARQWEGAGRPILPHLAIPCSARPELRV